jgi:hypothetical protein
MKAITGLILAVGLFVGVPIGCAVLSTVNSAATAPSRVINKTLETDNIIYSYEWFFNTNAQYTARAAQISEYKAFTDTDPEERARLRMELSAVKQSCRELANNYNANGMKLNRTFFRSKNLPETLDVEICE